MVFKMTEENRCCTSRPMRQFPVMNVGWVRCAFYRHINPSLDSERTVSQQPAVPDL